jgi:hypothetical protein
MVRGALHRRVNREFPLVHPRNFESFPPTVLRHSTHMRDFGANFVRVHVCLRDDSALGAPLPSALGSGRLRDAPGCRELDPRPCPSSRFALFTRSADGRFSGSDCRPTTSATYFRRTVTLPSIRFSRFDGPPSRGTAESALGLVMLFWGTTTSPSRRRMTSAASRDSPSGARPTALQARRWTRPRKLRPIGTPLAGDASIRPPFAVVAVERQHWTARAE